LDVARGPTSQSFPAQRGRPFPEHAVGNSPIELFPCTSWTRYHSVYYRDAWTNSRFRPTECVFEHGFTLQSQLVFNGPLIVDIENKLIPGITFAVGARPAAVPAPVGRRLRGRLLT
jgi:hypothetical protein